LQQWQTTFADRVYFAIKRTQRANEDRFIEQAIRMSNAFDVPIIAHNDVRFLTEDDFEAHEARVCIANSQVLADPNRPRDYSSEQYLKTQAQMTALFSDMPAVIDNTLDLAKRCNVIIPMGHHDLPEFPIPEGDTIETFFRRTAQEGLE
ncbi:DNA polymerase III subunit alpha, partial [Xanthomonas citri pv. citri]